LTITGLLITYIALNLMDGHGQPALLYIVPFILGKNTEPTTDVLEPKAMYVLKLRMVWGAMCQVLCSCWVTREVTWRRCGQQGNPTGHALTFVFNLNRLKTTCYVSDGNR